MQRKPGAGRIEVLRSALHGMGVFARRAMPAGTRVIEYQGDRIPWNEARDEPDGIVCLFSVGRNRVVDGRRNGNEARFINHSCEPNCEAVLDDGRIFIETIRPVRKGDELLYDYSLDLGRRPTRADREQYACHCGAPRCRKTMLDLARCTPEKQSPAAASPGSMKNARRGSRCCREGSRLGGLG